MTAERIDALFFSYYADVDRWHNDWPEGFAPLPPRAGAEGLDRTLMGRIERQSARIDGKVHDFPRFLSRVRYGDTSEYRRWDAYTPTHLSGAYYESLLLDEEISFRHVGYADRLELERLKERFTPRYVLLSTSFLIEAPTILDAAQRLRRAWPEAILVLGGFMLGELRRDLGEARFERLLRAWGADAYVMSPMGEEALLSILRARGRELRDLELPETFVREQDGTYRLSTERPEAGHPLDDHPVRWDRLDPGGLYHTVHLRTARSCSFRCSFCSLFVVEGSLAFAEPTTLRAELEALSRVEKVDSIVFTDDTFNVPRKRFAELVDILGEFDFEWYSFYRSQFADDSTIRRMKESGCRGLFLGLESLDDGVLKKMNKAATLASYERGLEQILEYEIPCHANFIIGFPGDVPENAHRVVEFVDRWNIPFYSVSPWFCAPSTPIYEQREQYGVEGKYYDWKHETMNSTQAIELEQWMIKQPQRSVYMSQLSSDHFWSEIMFYCNGFSVEETRVAGRTFNDFAGLDTPGESLDVDPRIAALREVLASREMPPPPDTEQN